MKVRCNIEVPAAIEAPLRMIAEMCRISPDEVAQRCLSSVFGDLGGPNSTDVSMAKMIGRFPELPPFIRSEIERMILSQEAGSFDFKRMMRKAQ